MRSSNNSACREVSLELFDLKNMQNLLGTRDRQLEASGNGLDDNVTLLYTAFFELCDGAVDKRFNNGLVPSRVDYSNS